MRARTELRNFGIMAHVDAGKTTVSERILFLTGKIHRIGEVHHGQATFDDDPRERDRGITIGAAASSAPWSDHVLNLIDTPGHIDFSVEVERSLRVLDGAVAVFDAVAGVEPQSETVWNQADRHGVPRLVFINKMDRPGADFDRCCRDIASRLGAELAVVQRPVFDDDRFVGVVDVIGGSEWRWSDPDDPRSVEVTPVRDPEQQQAIDEARLVLIDRLVTLDGFDDTTLERWIDGSLELDEIRAALRRLTVGGAVVPVLCGAALASIGIQPLLDAVVAYLPSPADRSDVVAFGPDGPVDHPTTVESSLTALAFKVVHRSGGKLTWVRVYSGSLSTGDRVLVTGSGPGPDGTVTADNRARVGHLVQLHAGKTVDVERLVAGDIGAVMGLKEATTGSTLCDPANGLQLESMRFPDPVVGVAIEPRTTRDQDRLSVALRRLADEDPTFRVSTHPETGQTIVSGMGELHLDVVVAKLADDHGVEVRTGEPEVAYRETITRPVRGFAYKLKKQTGGPGSFAVVVIDIEPTGSTVPGQLEFVDNIKGGAVPAEFAAAFAAGAREALSRGPIDGYPLVGVKVTLTDGSTHPVDSSERSFHQAGVLALTEAAVEAGPQRLEPVMAVTVIGPEDCIGSITSLVSQRRGITLGVARDQADEAGRNQRPVRLEAQVPLAELFGFTGALRSATQGRASASMVPDGHQPG